MIYVKKPAQLHHCSIFKALFIHLMFFFHSNDDLVYIVSVALLLCSLVTQAAFDGV